MRMKGRQNLKAKVSAGKVEKLNVTCYTKVFSRVSVFALENKVADDQVKVRGIF